jgi:hypothetical protein
MAGERFENRALARKLHVGVTSGWQGERRLAYPAKFMAPSGLTHSARGRAPLNSDSGPSLAAII